MVGGSTATTRSLRKKIFQVPQGISADSDRHPRRLHAREDLDGLALRSQQNAGPRATRKRGVSKKSLFAVEGPDQRPSGLSTARNNPRPDTSAAGLAALKPAFVDVGQAQGGPRTAKDLRRARAQALSTGQRDQAPSFRRQLEAAWSNGPPRRSSWPRKITWKKSGSQAAPPRSGTMATIGRRAGHHADRAHAGVERRLSPAAGMKASDNRSLGDQRSLLLRSVVADHPQSQAGPEQGQRQRAAALRLGHPLGADRGHADRHGARRARAAGSRHGADHDVASAAGQGHRGRSSNESRDALHLPGPQLFQATFRPGLCPSAARKGAGSHRTTRGRFLRFDHRGPAVGTGLLHRGASLAKRGSTTALQPLQKLAVRRARSRRSSAAAPRAGSRVRRHSSEWPRSVAAPALGAAPALRGAASGPPGHRSRPRCS